MMFPGGLDRALGGVEVSEWFDWMRREISRGGIDLPDEETATFFSAHALQLRDRIRDLCRHLPISLENRLIESVIVYQCWQRHRSVYQSPEMFELRSCTLRIVEAVRYIRAMGSRWGGHLVEASNGLPYVVNVPTGYECEKGPATEIICNRLSRLIGLPVPDVALVVAAGAVIPLATDRRPALGLIPKPGRAPKLCVGFRYLSRSPDGVASAMGDLSARNLRHLVGALIFDIWTLRLSERRWSTSFSEATGRTELTLLGGGDCLAGGDWLRFIGSGFPRRPAQQVASEIRRWGQISPWLAKIRDLDLNKIWELAFQMPPEWYGGQRRLLAEVLDVISLRQRMLQSNVRDYEREGYFPALRMTQAPNGAPPQTRRRSA